MATTTLQNSTSTTINIDQFEQQMQGDPSSPTFSDLEGNISGMSAPKTAAAPDYDKQFDTLDEPVMDTVKRDLAAVGSKFTHVLYPARNESLLRDWDLWGPLFICVFMSLLLQGGGEQDSQGPQFTDVFMITFFGSFVVTLNIKLLGGTISFFQSLCVLGYCLLPICAAAVFSRVLLTVLTVTAVTFWLRLAVTVVAFCWATYASMAFLSGSHPPRRKALAIYPIFLFYFVISWMVASHS